LGKAPSPPASSRNSLLSILGLIGICLMFSSWPPDTVSNTTLFWAPPCRASKSLLCHHVLLFLLKIAIWHSSLYLFWERPSITPSQLPLFFLNIPGRYGSRRTEFCIELRILFIVRGRLELSNSGRIRVFSFHSSLTLSLYNTICCSRYPFFCLSCSVRPRLRRSLLLCETY